MRPEKNTESATDQESVAPSESLFTGRLPEAPPSTSIGAAVLHAETERVEAELQASSLRKGADELRTLERRAQTMRTPVYGLSLAALRYQVGLRTGASMPADDYARLKNPPLPLDALESSAEQLDRRAEKHAERQSEEIKRVRQAMRRLSPTQRSSLDEYFNKSAPAFLKAQQEKSDMSDWAGWLATDDRFLKGANNETLTKVLQWHDGVVQKAREKLEPVIEQARVASFAFAAQQYESGRYASPPQSLDETVYDVQDIFQTTLTGHGGFAMPNHNYIAVAQDVSGEELAHYLSHENMHVMYGIGTKPVWFAEAMTENESLLLDHGTNDDTIGVYTIERMLLRTITGSDESDLARLALRAHTGGEEHMQEFKAAFDAEYGTEDGFDALNAAVESRRTHIREKYKEHLDLKIPFDHAEARDRIRAMPVVDVTWLIQEHGMIDGLREARARWPVAADKPIGS